MATEKKAKRGVPLFDAATTSQIVQEALGSKNMAEVARKYGTTEHNVYRWVRLHRRQTSPQIPTDAKPVGGASQRVAGGQYRTGNAEVKRLQEENRKLYEMLGRLTLTNNLSPK